MNVVSAESLGAAGLLDLFNAGFSDYVVPMQLDAAALRGHVRTNDVDLARSPVAVVDGEPAAFALLGIRAADAWIGGMATAPPHRRSGLAAAVLEAAAAAASDAGCDTLGLEVVDANAPAVALYRRAGFQVERDLIVWTLPAAPRAAPGRPLDASAAQAWIATHRPAAEPWQRADATLAHLRSREPMARATRWRTPSSFRSAGGGSPAHLWDQNRLPQGRRNTPRAVRHACG